MPNRPEKAEIVPEPTPQALPLPNLRPEQWEKITKLAHLLASTNIETSISGDATGNMVITAGRDVIYLSLAERQALPRAVPYVADADQRVPLALTGLFVSEDLAPGPDPAALLQTHLEEVAGRLEREEPWATGLRGYVPLAIHLGQCFSLRTLPRGGPGPGRHFEERARFNDSPCTASSCWVSRERANPPPCANWPSRPFGPAWPTRMPPFLSLSG
jgi:hypothetical protein